MIADFFSMLMSGSIHLIVYTVLAIPALVLLRLGYIAYFLFNTRTPETVPAQRTVEATKTKPKAKAKAKATPVKAKHSVVANYSDKYKLPPNTFE
tara:strand:+ start:86 stop:370 length:285 start_codon:yes stop_codon:yes gene_type:complete